MKNIPRVVLLFVSLAAGAAALAAAPRRPPLAPADVDAIAKLEMLEDTRQFDEAALAAMLRSTHPEVRRRAAQAIGRIVDPRGRALLMTAQGDADPEVRATVAFADGQLKDAESVPWLASVLSSPATPPAVAREAARSLGKIRSPEARAALVTYLTAAPARPATAPIAGEALLALGRFPPPIDLAAIARWTTSAEPELRWRAAWALYRPRDAAAVPAVIGLTADTSAEVRFWAMRGLTVPLAAPARGGAAPPAVPDWSGVDKARTSAILRSALADPDRRVRTEALRALTTYNDDQSFAAIMTALDSSDTWLSVSAAEALGRFAARKEVVVPRLVAAASSNHPLALRITALTPLASVSPDAALETAGALARETSIVARTAAIGVLRRLGPPGASKLDELTAADPSLKSLLPQPGATRPAPPAKPTRPESDYRQLVERWIVPDYNGAAKPHAVLDTPRGSIEIELYAGDAPLGLEYFIRTVTSGEIVGTEFGRVVPNFVAQQRAIRTDVVLRDEVSRLGLTRGNLSWASGGLDTGRPGYTLGNTPQPHNEGDFTALGRVVRGMDVVDRIELGDKITGARMLR